MSKLYFLLGINIKINIYYNNVYENDIIQDARSLLFGRTKPAS